MEQQAGFENSFLHEVDKKGRLSVPHAFRLLLPETSEGRALVLNSVDSEEPCLVGQSPLFADRRLASFDATQDGMITEAMLDEAASQFGPNNRVVLDGDGRIILSATMKALGGINGHALFIGSGRWFQLWDPWIYLGRQQTRPTMRRLVTAMLVARNLPLDGPPA